MGFPSVALLFAAGIGYAAHWPAPAGFGCVHCELTTKVESAGRQGTAIPALTPASLSPCPHALPGSARKVHMLLTGTVLAGGQGPVHRGHLHQRRDKAWEGHWIDYARPAAPTRRRLHPTEQEARRKARGRPWKHGVRPAPLARKTITRTTPTVLRVRRGAAVAVGGWPAATGARSRNVGRRAPEHRRKQTLAPFASSAAFPHRVQNVNASVVDRHASIPKASWGTVVSRFCALSAAFLSPRDLPLLETARTASLHRRLAAS